MDIRLAVKSYKHSSSSVSGERLINCFAEPQPGGAKAPVIVRGCPGISEWSRIGVGPIRGAIKMNGLTYIVSGAELWSVDANKNAVLRGSGITGQGLVGMAENGFEIVIATGLGVFSYLVSAGTTIAVVGVDAADTVTFMNGRFVLEKKGTNQFYISAVNDGRTYDPLDFASAEGDSDIILVVKQFNGLLYMFGPKTIEVWEYTGAALFPFQAIPGNVLAYGIQNSRMIAVDDSTVFFMGTDRVAYRLTGGGVGRISDYAIEQRWAALASVSDGFAFTVPSEGHKMIYFTYPSASVTFGYDLSTNLWHERNSYDYTGVERSWRIGMSIVTDSGLILVGDRESSILGAIDNEVWTEFGNPLITTVITPPVSDRGRDMAVNCLELDMETGVGLTTGQGSDPKIIMSYSRDGGKTFGNERENGLGKRGEYGTRVRWTGLGSGRQYSFKFVVSDPVKRTFLAARIPDFYSS